MTLANRTERRPQDRARPTGKRPAPGHRRDGPGLVTLLLLALVPSLVWAAVAYPLGAVLALAVLGPFSAVLLLPYLLLRRRKRSLPARSALRDLLNRLNPFT